MPKLNAAKTLRVSANMVITGSKKLSPAEKEGLDVPEAVRVIILDADVNLEIIDEALLDATVPFCEFSTGSVGYKVQGTITLP